MPRRSKGQDIPKRINSSQSHSILRADKKDRRSIQNALRGKELLLLWPPAVFQLVRRYREGRCKKRNERTCIRSFLFFRSVASSEANVYRTLSFFVRSALAGHRYLPDAHYSVIISRGDACSVRGPGDSEYFATMIAVGQRGSPCCALPYLYGLAGVG